MIQAALLNRGARAGNDRLERDLEVSNLINALDVLDGQRRVAIRDGAPKEHLDELDDEEAGYRARIEALGGMISQ